MIVWGWYKRGDGRLIMNKTIFFKCHTDGDMPDGFAGSSASITVNDIIKVEVHTCIGWIDVTDDFETTSNSMDYRFTI